MHIRQQRTSFFLFGFSFTNIYDLQDNGGSEGGEGGRSIFLPQLPPASQTLRHQPDNNRRELTSVQSQQLDLNGKPLVSNCKQLTTSLLALRFIASREESKTKNTINVLLARKTLCNSTCGGDLNELHEAKVNKAAKTLASLQ